MKNLYVVIMAGGVGSRFWPLSRTPHPKQFLDILGTGRTLIQQTFDRFSSIVPTKNIFVVTNKAYEELVLEQLPKLKSDQILSEPISRNTAPCIAYASYKIHNLNPKAITIVAPSDHVILKEKAFQKIITKAVDGANKNNILVTVGIQPNRPDTGYGYIQFMEEKKLPNLKKVKTFTEKPHLELAKTFIKSGDFLWNSGMFIWSTQNVIEAFENHLADMADIFKEGEKFYNTSKEVGFISKSYSLCRNVSIDFGLMEKATNTYVIPGDFEWSDVGTWTSLYQLHDKDGDKNAVAGNVLLEDSNNCIINLPKDKLAFIQGMEDFIIAESNGVLLICKKEKEQEIKNYVAKVKSKKGAKFV